MRYDVKAPENNNRDRANVKKAGCQAAGDDDAKEQEDARRRALADTLPPRTPRDWYEGTLIKLLTDHGGQHNLRVIVVVGAGGMGKTYTAKSAYQDPFTKIRLVKLGVVLHECKGPVFRHLYRAIENLSKCLRSLSIRITADKENADMNMEGALLLIPPKYLQKLEISGLGNGLPPWVEKLGLLTKITLHKTRLTAGDIEILGKLTSLCYLRLRHESCSESKLTFSKGEFQSLKFLVIECSDITSINFDKETSPKLKKIVWSSTGKQSLSGIESLPKLQELELTGNFNLETVEQAIAANKNNPILVANIGVPEEELYASGDEDVYASGDEDVYASGDEDVLISSP